MDSPPAQLASAAPATRARLQAGFARRLRRAAYVPLVVMLLFAALLALAVEALLDRAQWVEHTHTVIGAANKCLLLAVDIETGMRGFQITGEAQFLQPLEVARAALPRTTQELLTLVADNPAQLSAARALQEEVNEYVTFAGDLVARRRGSGIITLAENRESKQRFDAIREKFRGFINEEERLLARRTTTFTTRSRLDTLVRFGGAIVIGILLAAFIRRQLQQLRADYEATLIELQERARDLKASEEEYRELNAELEARVGERTAALSAANERLQEVDRLKSEFLASMSHELRTPLNSIIGFNEIIWGGLAGPINEEQKTQLGMALNSARHLLHLINDLLDLARIESGRVDPVWVWFDLREVADEVVATLQPLAAGKRLPLEVRVPTELRIRSDRKMVFQILLNLVNNAVKFTEAGRVRLEARRSGEAIELEVTDTGVGILPENLAMIFESFRQVDGTARRTVEGTGLGLYLCKRLAAILGGDITARSTYGVGSTFTVRLPSNPNLG